ncbi:MAG: hypothetical protein K9K62_01350 [Desulfobacteraceae bacterium]|nr:hypothetical protein [Desulfobacteraceae bacterium]
MNTGTGSCHPIAAFFAVVFSLIAMPLAAFGSDTGFAAAEFEAYGKIEHFTWNEYVNGEQLLEESGPIYGAGGSVRLPITQIVTAKFRGELFGGKIDYDGQTILGNYPLTSDTDYAGVKLEADVGMDLVPGEKSEIGPFGGFGARLWQRDIQGNTFWNPDSQTTEYARGAAERWRNYYARAGINGAHAFSRRLEVFVTAGVKIPIYTENEAELTDSVFITLEPGNRVSGFAETGLEIGMVKLSIFYEGLRFSESDRVAFGNSYYYQPKSEADIFGINAGVTF